MNEDFLTRACEIDQLAGTEVTLRVHEADENKTAPWNRTSVEQNFKQHARKPPQDRTHAYFGECDLWYIGKLFLWSGAATMGSRCNVPKDFLDHPLFADIVEIGSQVLVGGTGMNQAEV